MINLKSERQAITVSNLRGGVGDLIREDLVMADQSFDKFNTCAVLTIPDGASIGEHPHGPDAELYYILTGTLRVTDDGVTKDLVPGDAVYTGGGNFHSVVNVSGKDASMLAVVVR